MNDLIQRFEAWLRENRPDYLAHLRPGADDAALDNFESTFSLRLPEDFRAFYRWRDGQSEDCTDSLYDNMMFSPLESVRETKTMLDEMIGTDFDDPTWWRKGWVPFLDNGGGDHVCLDVEAVDFGEPGQIVTFWHDWDRREAEHASFRAFFEDLVTAFEQGLFEEVDD